MKKQHWQVLEPIEAIVFDCDSTLSLIEGIDQIAERKGVLAQVHHLTERAMSETGVFNTMYTERLEFVKPNFEDMLWLADRYYENRTEHVNEVIEILAGLGKKLFIASAGLLPPIELFAKRLHIPAEHVHAVDIYFNEDGSYKNYDHQSILIEHKARVVGKIKESYPRIVHIGDGMNDVEAAYIATRFIGYGGKAYRAKVAELSHFYILCRSLLPLLPLLLTAEEAASLKNNAARCYEEGLQLLRHGEVEGAA